MAKEPIVSKGAKPPSALPNAPGKTAQKPKPATPKPSPDTAKVQGKVVRKDPPVDNDPPVTKKPAPPAKKPSAATPVKGKVVRKDPPAAQGRTQPIAAKTLDFENEAASEDAAAAFLTQAFGDDEETEPAPDEVTANGATQAFDGDSLDAEASDPAQDEALAGSTQAFDGDTLDNDQKPSVDATQAIDNDTLDSEMSNDEPPIRNKTQQISDQTIDTEMPKRPARKPAPAPARTEKGTPMASMLGKYKLLKKLGQGGMGAVYKAHDEKLDRIVAIKVLAKELSGKENYVKRFEREAQVMVKMDHPNVIRAFDFDLDKEKNLHYLAIEFVEGGSIENWLKKLGRFSVGDALHIILKTAAGLQHAHEKSLIHRDVKPDNLLLTKDGIVKVADLGLAKDTEEDTSLTKTGAGAGTPIYMAPEQARDVKHVDCRADIYALGVMLYVFLTGQPPFAGNTLVELISAKEKGKFDPMRKHNDEVPSKLDLIVDKMIAKDPKNRYASCQDVIDQIEPLGLANEQLSFIDVEDSPAASAGSATKTPGPKAAPTSGPAKIVAKTSVGNAGKAPMQKTSIKAPAMTTSGPDEEEEVVEDVWYWMMLTPAGKQITKKVTTDQVRTAIKAGHMDPEAQLSKKPTGFRAAGTFPEFQAIFKSQKISTKANVKGAKNRDKFREIEEEDARRRKYGWISRMFKSFGSTVFGLLWIVLILGIVGGGGYFIYMYMQ